MPAGFARCDPADAGRKLSEQKLSILLTIRVLFVSYERTSLRAKSDLVFPSPNISERVTVS